MKKRIIWICLLAAALACLLPAAMAEVAVNITFDKQSVAVGETITADYEITGLDAIEVVYGEWLITYSNGSSQGAGYFESAELSGSASCTPTGGVSLQLFLYVTDTNGKYYDVESEAIPIGGVVEPGELSVSLSFDRDSVAVGETITASYEITGVDAVEVVYGGWLVTGSDGKSQSTGDFESTELSGSASYTPESGVSLQFFLFVTDANGNDYDVESEMIPITGSASTGTPSVSIRFNKDRVIAGEAITASYEITGVDAIDILYGEWIIKLSDGKSQGAGEFESTGLSGKSSCTPAGGESLQLFLYVTDVNGAFYDVESEIIPIVNLGEIVLTLPENLVQIRQEAFAGLPCVDVLCPAILEEIGSRAFADCKELARITIPSAQTVIAEDAFQGCPADMLIVAPAGSLAEAHAEIYGYSFRAM